jgi:excisionase family DNA binding protein
MDKARRSQSRKKLPSRVYSVDQTADVLGVCRASIYNMMIDGELPYIVIAGRRRVPVEIVENLLKIEA